MRVIATTDGADSEPSGEVTATPAETTPPGLSSASVDGATLTLTFDEALDKGNTPDISNFAVAVGGSSRGVDAVAMSGSAVTLTLVTVAEAGDAVTVDYTAPTGQSDARLQDLAGNTAASFNGQVVTNNTAPAPVPGSPTNLQVAGTRAASSWRPGTPPNPAPHPPGTPSSGKSQATTGRTRTTSREPASPAHPTSSPA